MKKKLMIIIPVVLLLAGGAYKFVFAKAEEPEPKVHGMVYVMPKEFLINLADGRFTKLSVALVLDHEMEKELAGGGHGGAAPPEGFGPLAQEAIVRDIVTNTLTDAKADDLIDEKGRKRLKATVLHHIEEETDVKAHEVLFTDVAVQ